MLYVLTALQFITVIIILIVEESMLSTHCKIIFDGTNCLAFTSWLIEIKIVMRIWVQVYSKPLNITAVNNFNSKY